ncbi:S66 family peptidase [Nonomuraea angiospora]|uniref:S66 family peptidase n=1 Tax=Nonomuraea angiospora TaxID=46172 RepID=UPI0029B1A2FE|nr:LD-carboxypeptidase [Nonomuraea angiospora]MDX3111428.1 LD-carboxypeptidase [Nonomuraea angiospora]
MDVLFPPKLNAGDVIRVVAPARSRAMVMEHDHSDLIRSRFAELGLTLSYGAHVDERDAFDSSSVASRVADLHEAFADPSVAGILTVIGGYNCNELLPYLDWDLIRANPKILCGYSDITALQNAILARTGLVTYSGPHWSTFGMRDHLEETLRWFTSVMFDTAPVALTPAARWSDDLWFLDQDKRELIPNEGWWPLRPGTAEGRIVGGNLSTLSLLRGTPYMPSLDGAILIVEDDFESHPARFARDLTSLLQLPDAPKIRGLAIGRFQQASGMSRPLLEQIIATQPALSRLPVLANIDVGHTTPLATFPIGGQARLTVGDAVTDSGTTSLTLLRH